MTYKEKFTTKEVPLTTIFIDGLTGTPYQDTSVTKFDMYEVFSGGDDPGYRRRIKSQANATNGATAYRNTVDAAGGSATASFAHLKGIEGGEGYQIDYIDQYAAYGAVVGALGPKNGTEGPSETALNQAKSNFVSKARRAVSPSQAMVTLGELKETINQIRNPFSVLRKRTAAHLNLLRKKRKGFYRAKRNSKLKFLSDSWLEYSFGVAPLIGDIKSSAEALASYFTRPSPVIPIRAIGRDNELLDIQQSGGGIGPFTYSYDVVTRKVSMCSIYGGVIIKPTSDVTIPEVFGVTLTEFVPTVWELIPYSFLVDYFSNVGKLLEGVSFCTSSLAYHGQSTTVQTIQSINNVQYNRENFAPPDFHSGFGGWLNHNFSPGHCITVDKSFNRSVPENYIPSLQFQLPGSVWKYGNITALVDSHRKLLPF
jgi:hypothetical protein